MATVQKHGKDSNPSPIPRSRMGGVWVASVLFALVLLILLIFVLQNGQRADVSFLGFRWQLPMGVALLLAAVFGILLVALPGSARIVQLRLLDRRHQRRAGRQAAAAATVTPPAAGAPAAEPAANEPAVDEPTTAGPLTAEPAAAEPIADISPEQVPPGR